MFTRNRSGPGRLFLRPLQGAHALQGRLYAAYDSTRRDDKGCWLWRIVGPICLRTSPSFATVLQDPQWNSTAISSSYDVRRVDFAQVGNFAATVPYNIVKDLARCLADASARSIRRRRGNDAQATVSWLQ